MNIIVFHGRLNPPHIGHLAALKMLDARAKSEQATAYISLTGTQDPEKNPLSFEQKKHYVEVAIAELGLNISVIDHPTIKIYDLMRDMSFECSKTGGGVVTLMAGEDRIESYQKMANSMIAKYQGRGECLDVSVVVEQTMTRDADISYSATQMRAHVANGDVDAFVSHCPFTDEKEAIAMFDDCSRGMGLEPITESRPWRFKLVDVTDTIQLKEAQMSKGLTDMQQITKEMAALVSQHINQLSGQPDKLYYVGGCVRDIVEGKTPNDLDLLTTMYYKDYAALFETQDIRFRGKQIVVVPVIEGEEFETGCLPKGTTLADRAAISDLTMNSMIQDIETGEIYDPLGGQKDMAAGIIRATPFSIECFNKGTHPTTLLRVLRFFATRDMVLDTETEESLRTFSSITGGKIDVSERQWDHDFQKVLKAGPEAIFNFVQAMREYGFHEDAMKHQSYVDAIEHMEV